jgi:NitT/TauT family transport system permease protein
MKSVPPPNRIEQFLWPVLVGGLLLLLWHEAVKWTGSKVFPSPVEVSRGVVELWKTGVLLLYIEDSLRRVSIGFGLGLMLGVPTGLSLGCCPSAGQVVNPVIQMVRPISPIAWIPLAIVWWGVGDAAAVYLIFMATYFPIVVASMNGVRGVPIIFRQAGHNFGLNSAQLLAMVIFPASLPQILLGLRIALGIAWLVVVAAEMIAVDSGLGYLVIDARNSGKRYDLVVTAMLIIGLIGLVLDLALRQVEKFKAVRWGFRYDS